MIVCIRPESFELSGDTGIGMHISVVEETGADSYLYGTLTDNEDAALAGNEPQIVARVTTRTPPTRGAAVNLRVDPATVHVFDTETGARLS